MKTEKSMVSTIDASQQDRIGSSGRSLQEMEAYMKRGRRLHSEFTAVFMRASGRKLKAGYLCVTSPLTKAGKRVWGAGELLYYNFFRSGRSNVICKCEQR